MSRLYRFELAFDGEPQGVGFLQGLDDIGLWNVVTSNLYSLFDILPAPKLDESVSFWFTEYGVAWFEDAINQVIDEIAENNWQLLGAVIDDDLQESIYHDEFQAAFHLEYIGSMSIEYVEVRDIGEFMQDVDK